MPLNFQKTLFIFNVKGAVMQIRKFICQSPRYDLLKP